MNIKSFLTKMADRESYSTSEKVIGKWIDGKPIYRKTFNGTVGTDIDIVGLKIESFVKGYGSATSIYGHRWALPSVFSGTDEYNCGIFLHPVPNPQKLAVGYGDYMVGQPYTVTIEYTKTTD